jgi:hypothetical protein
MTLNTSQPISFLKLYNEKVRQYLKYRPAQNLTFEPKTLIMNRGPATDLG